MKFSIPRAQFADGDEEDDLGIYDDDEEEVEEIVRD